MRLQHHHLGLNLGLLVVLSASASAYPNHTLPSFDWAAVRPTRRLVYHDCYTSYRCARLALPLDWPAWQNASSSSSDSDPHANLASDPDPHANLASDSDSSSSTVSIAVIKLPARVPPTHPTFGGSILTNPGGPGGSGIDLVLNAGRYLQEYVDQPGQRHYEIVSFDPRGVGRSRPAANCFPGSVLARDAVLLEGRGLGLGSLSGDEAGRERLAYGLAMMEGFGRKCARGEEEEGSDKILGYMGTASVARDMLALVDEMDALRGATTSRSEGEHEREEHGAELRRRRAGGDEPPRLQYIGFSYGTILGNYFAAMFPGRVGRMVLDGVCNVEDYTRGGGWLTNTPDADAVVTTLFTGCHHAGPSVCPLSLPNDTSPSDPLTRFTTFLARLDAAPLAGLSPSSGAPLVLTGADVRLLLTTAAYKPLSSYRPLAHLLAGLMRGRPQDIRDVLAGLEPTLLGGGSLEDACPPFPDDDDDGPAPAPDAAGADPTAAILCGDGEDVTDRNLTWWQGYIAAQRNTSAFLGARWAGIRFLCSRWRFRANWAFDGPFTTPEPAPAPEHAHGGRPAAPLLFLSNRLDPVTPLAAARAMARGHPRAGVVVQEAAGHCALVAAYSRCTRDIVADLFATGRVPPREVTCEAECGPWDVGCGGGRGAMRGDGRARGEGEMWFARRFPLGI